MTAANDNARQIGYASEKAQSERMENERLSRIAETLLAPSDTKADSDGDDGA